MHAVNVVLDALEDAGLLIKSHDDPPAYLPARDLNAVSVAELMSTIRKAGEDRFLDPESLSLPEAAEELLQRADGALVASLENASVKSLAAGGSHLNRREWRRDDDGVAGEHPSKVRVLKEEDD